MRCYYDLNVRVDVFNYPSSMAMKFLSYLDAKERLMDFPTSSMAIRLLLIGEFCVLCLF